MRASTNTLCLNVLELKSVTYLLTLWSNILSRIENSMQKAVSNSCLRFSTNLVNFTIDSIYLLSKFPYDFDSRVTNALCNTTKNDTYDSH